MITIDRRIGASNTQNDDQIESFGLKQENKIIFEEINEITGPIRGNT